MDLEQIGKRGSRAAASDAAPQLQFLLQSAKAWRQLDNIVKQELPANLHPHVQTACIEEGALVLLAANNMAASRLKMIAPALLPRLQRHSDLIQSVRVKTVPKPAAPPRQNSLRLSAAAAEGFRRSAEQLQHHPQLAAALRRLAGKYQK